MAIILEPTRDLAEQTYRTCVDLASRMPPLTTNNQQYMISAALLVGGMNPQPTLDLLQKNKVDILVGTPPIVSSMIQRRKLLTNNCQLFILDEADQLLVDSSYRDQILQIYQSFQTGRREAMNRLQVCFFSATLHSREVQTLTERICHRPTWVDLRGKDNSKLPDTIHHCIICVHPSSYETMVQTQSPGLVTTDAVHRGGEIGDTVNFSSLSEKEADSERIKLLKPRVLVDVMEQFKMEQVLVFCRTNLDCDLLEQYLKQVGGADGINRFSCRVLAGMRSMTERQANLKAFMEGEIRVLIATDVAARGIDIPELPFVVQMILPFGTKPSETYVHRVGRVGRANRMGLAICIIGEAKEKVWWCQNGQKPPCANTSLFENGGMFTYELLHCQKIMWNAHVE
jgi:ATP-dependent RNA helicase DDX1